MLLKFSQKKEQKPKITSGLIAEETTLKTKKLELTAKVILASSKLLEERLKVTFHHQNGKDRGLWLDTFSTLIVMLGSINAIQKCL